MVVALGGVLLEDLPTPAKRSSSSASPAKARRDADLDEAEKLIVSLRIERGIPAYWSELPDAGIMTRDMHRICRQCEGWGLRNRDRHDIAFLCESCDRSGLSIRTSLPKTAAPARAKRVTRVLER